MITPQQFEKLLPLACDWAEQQERIILRDGVPLTTAQVADARRAGVAHPENVRLLKVDSVPMPDHPLLRAAAETTQLMPPLAAGFTLRYGIFVRADRWSDRQLIVHELVHTAQFERLGGVGPFLRRYLTECLTIGYPAAPMEQEAVLTANRLCSTQE
jgi:hypothetical protein